MQVPSHRFFRFYPAALKLRPRIGDVWKREGGNFIRKAVFSGFGVNHPQVGQAEVFQYRLHRQRFLGDITCLTRSKNFI